MKNTKTGIIIILIVALCFTLISKNLLRKGNELYKKQFLERQWNSTRLSERLIDMQRQLDILYENQRMSDTLYVINMLHEIYDTDTVQCIYVDENTSDIELLKILHSYKCEDSIPDVLKEMMNDRIRKIENKLDFKY